MNLPAMGPTQPSPLAQSVALALAPAKAKPRVWTMRESLLAAVLAARIHGDADKVRSATLRAYALMTDPQREALLMIVECPDPLWLVDRILEELEIMTAEELKQAALVSAEFAKISRLVGVPDGAPLSMTTKRVDDCSRMIDHQLATEKRLEAEVYALQDQVKGLQELMAEAEQIAIAPAPAPESDFDLGKRLRREDTAVSDLWAIVQAAGADFHDVLTGYTTAGISE